MYLHGMNEHDLPLSHGDDHKTHAFSNAGPIPESEVDLMAEMVGNNVLTATIAGLARQAVQNPSMFPSMFAGQRGEEKGRELKQSVHISGNQGEPGLPVRTYNVSYTTELSYGKEANVLSSALTSTGAMPLFQEEVDKMKSDLRTAILNNKNGSAFSRETDLVRVLGLMDKRKVRFDAFFNKVMERGSQTYLMLTAQHGTLGMVKRLLQKGATPLCKDIYERDAFFYALQNTKKNLRSEIMSELLDSACPEGGPVTDIPVLLWVDAHQTNNQVLIDLLKKRGGIKVTNFTRNSQGIVEQTIEYSSGGAVNPVSGIDPDANIENIVSQEPTDMGNGKKKKKKKKRQAGGADTVFAIDNKPISDTPISDTPISDTNDGEVQESHACENNTHEEVPQKSVDTKEQWWKDKVSEQYRQEWELLITNGNFPSQQAEKKALRNFLAKKRRAETIPQEQEQQASSMSTSNREQESRQDLIQDISEMVVHQEEGAQGSKGQENEGKERACAQVASKMQLSSPMLRTVSRKKTVACADIESSINRYFSKGCEVRVAGRAAEVEIIAQHTIPDHETDIRQDVLMSEQERADDRLRSVIKVGNYQDMYRAIIAGANPFSCVNELVTLTIGAQLALLQVFQDCRLLAQEYEERLARRHDACKQYVTEKLKLLEDKYRQEDGDDEGTLEEKAARFVDQRGFWVQRKAQLNEYINVDLRAPECVMKWVAKEYERRRAREHKGSVRETISVKPRSKHACNKLDLAHKWGVLLREAAHKNDCSAIDAFTYDFHKGCPTIQVAYAKPGVIKNNPLGVEYYADEMGNTVLSTAVEHGNIEFANLLCERYPTALAGTRLFEKNQSGESVVSMLFDVTKRLVIEEDRFAFDMQCLLPFEELGEQEEATANSAQIFEFLQDALKKEAHKDSLIVFEFIKKIMRAHGLVKLPVGSYSVEDLMKIVRTN